LLTLWLLPCAFDNSSLRAANSHATQSEVDNLVKRIEARYGRMRGLAADFEQTYSGQGVSTRRERGRLFLQRPRRMRWEYTPAPGKLFIVNGREVWFYVPVDREATRADAGSVSDARFPFLFLLGTTNLRRLFRSISMVEASGAQQQEADARTLRLVPRERVSGLRELFLEVFGDGRISRIRILDEAGAVSEVTLTNVLENYIAPAEAFVFRPPPGVTVRILK
jgi:outer membrane lipoprotein carrier protein